MKIGILGTGDVGKTLGTAFVEAGHTVRLGSRTSDNPNAKGWASSAGASASHGTFADAAAFGELLVLATFGVADEAVIRLAGTASFDGKVVLDTTNPLDFSEGLPRLAIGHTDSCGELVQRTLPNARVVKVFNSVGHAHMVRPGFPGGPLDMLMAGEDAAAKSVASGIVEQFGWRPVDFGGIEASRYLEALAVIWIRQGIRTGQWNHALTFARR